MNNTQYAYELQEKKTEHGRKFIFISKGQDTIIKIVHYSYMRRLFDRSVYNLGFGDYDVSQDTIIDDINTNNGDAFKVLNTVLSTIPLFFSHYKNCGLMVRGSDSRPEFVANCKKACSKKCTEGCKNFNRRICIYGNYVSKHYAMLTIDYLFFGGLFKSDGDIALEQYTPWKSYDSILLFKRNT